MSISFNDKSLMAIRALITVMDRELAQDTTSPELRRAWAQLVSIMAVGPAPELRSCPRCKGVGMRAASRCSRCWLSLPALPATAAAAND